MEWRVVYSTFNITEAHIVAERLKVDGIPAMIHSQPGASALGIFVGNLGEVTILVREHEYEQALQILEPDLPDELPHSTDKVAYLGLDDDDDDSQHAD
jgi:hypothetical protein